MHTYFEVESRLLENETNSRFTFSRHLQKNKRCILVTLSCLLFYYLRFFSTTEFYSHLLESPVYILHVNSAFIGENDFPPKCILATTAHVLGTSIVHTTSIQRRIMVPCASPTSYYLFTEGVGDFIKVGKYFLLNQTRNFTVRNCLEEILGF